MICYHETSKEKKSGILDTCFKTQEGLFGTAIYLSSSIEGAMIFGEHLLKVMIPDDLIEHIRFVQWEQNHPDEDSWAAEMEALDHRVVAIRYESNEIEVCVYDPSIIKEIADCRYS